MRLIWKLLRQHISIGQLTGFFLANLFGMVIVLLSIQFYRDVAPFFTQNDSFMKNEYIVATKRISTLSSFAGKDNTFTQEEIQDIAGQPFTRKVGVFTPSAFKVTAGIGMDNSGIRLSTEMFFESVPDDFVDVQVHQWSYDPETKLIPIIVPRNYLNLYNFGFAQTRNLPKLTEGMLGLIQLDITIRGNGRTDVYKGQIAGFSNRLNTILVPQSFMELANRTYGGRTPANPARVMIEVNNPADPVIANYFRQHNYETEDNKLDAGKTAYFLRLIVGIVLGVGIFISVLSFFLLMLSIFLLLQKNNTKLESLLLIGYSPEKTAFPYQVMTVLLNLLIVCLSVGIVYWIRSAYTGPLSMLLPQWQPGSLFPAILTGLLLFLFVSSVNILTIYRKVLSIWKSPH